MTPVWITQLLSFVVENNPFAWLGKSLANIYNAMVYFLVSILTKPPRVNGGSFLDNIYANMFGIGIGLSTLITGVLLVFVVISNKARISFLEALVIAGVITFAATSLFTIFDSAVAVGDAAAQTVAATFPTQTESQYGALGYTIDGALSPLLFIFGYGFWLLPLGAVNMAIVFFYELFNVFLKVAILPSLALRPLGDKAKMWSNFLLTGALVSMVFGRPLMVACISLSYYAGGHFLGGTLLGKGVFLGAGMILSIFLQFKLWQSTERMVARVTNATTVSRITGTVNTKQSGASRVAAPSGNGGSGKFVPVLLTARIGAASKKAAVSAAKYGKTRASTGLRSAVASGAAKKAAGAAAGVATGGVATAATIAATTVATTAATKTASQKMSKKQLRSLPSPSSPSPVSPGAIPPPGSGMAPAGHHPIQEPKQRSLLKKGG